MFKSTTTLAVLAFVVVMMGGCNESDESADNSSHEHSHEHGHTHEHAERPESLNIAVDRIKTIHGSLRDSIDSGRVDDAHDLLHEVGPLIDVLPDVAADTDLTEEEWKGVKEAAGRLSGAFGELDESFHTEGSDHQTVYQGVAKTINAAIEEIVLRLPSTDEHQASDHTAADHANGVAEN